MIKAVCFLLAFIMIVADYFSKIWAFTALEHPIKLLPVLELRLAFNYGAAFSFLANHDGWQRWLFIGIGVIVCLYLIYAIISSNKSNYISLLGMACILGGALGNIIDRFVRGYVVDFIHVHYQHWSFPIFNVADSCISIGVALLILDWLLNLKKA